MFEVRGNFFLRNPDIAGYFLHGQSLFLEKGNNFLSCGLMPFRGNKRFFRFLIHPSSIFVLFVTSEFSVTQN